MMGWERAGQPARPRLRADQSEWEQKPHKKGEQQVEILLVMAGHQPFALLMSQVFNIVRPQGTGIKVVSLPDQEKGRAWGEIERENGNRLRVLELARMLHLPLVEPISRSQILLTGRVLPEGRIEHLFGLAVDDIQSATTVGLDKMRLLPDWLCRKRLGKLIWGVALLEQAFLAQQSALNEVTTASLLTPVQLDKFMSEAAGFEPINLLGEPKPETEARPVKLGEYRAEQKGSESRVRPVMLLDISTLKDIAFSD